MSQIQHTQTVQQQEEYLLTKEAFRGWLDNHFPHAYYPNLYIHIYLKEHGLPLDSKIEGL